MVGGDAGEVLALEVAEAMRHRGAPRRTERDTEGVRRVAREVALEHLYRVVVRRDRRDDDHRELCFCHRDLPQITAELRPFRIGQAPVDRHVEAEGRGDVVIDASAHMERAAIDAVGRQRACEARASYQRGAIVNLDSRVVPAEHSENPRVADVTAADQSRFADASERTGEKASGRYPDVTPGEPRARLVAANGSGVSRLGREVGNQCPLAPAGWSDPGIEVVVCREIEIIRGADLQIRASGRVGLDCIIAAGTVVQNEAHRVEVFGGRYRAGVILEEAAEPGAVVEESRVAEAEELEWRKRRECQRWQT